MKKMIFLLLLSINIIIIDTANGYYEVHQPTPAARQLTKEVLLYPDFTLNWLQPWKIKWRYLLEMPKKLYYNNDLRVGNICVNSFKTILHNALPIIGLLSLIRSFRYTLNQLNACIAEPKIDDIGSKTPTGEERFRSAVRALFGAISTVGFLGFLGYLCDIRKNARTYEI